MSNLEKKPGENPEESLSSEEAFALLESEEYGKLLEKTGFKEASALLRKFYESRHGFSYSNIFKTEDARSEFNFIAENLKSFAKTEHAKLKLALFYPAASKKELERRFAIVSKAKAKVKELEDKNRLKEIEALLSNIKQLKEEKFKIRDVIAVEDEDAYKDLAQRFEKYAEIYLVKTGDDLEYLKSCEFVRYVQENSAFLSQASYLENVEAVVNDEVSIIPELLINFFGKNKESVAAAIKIAEKAEIKGIEKEKLKKAEALLEFIGKDGSVSSSHSKELERKRNSLQMLEKLALDSLEKANKKIGEEVERVSLKGSEVLKIFREVERGRDEIYGSLPPDILTAITKNAEELEFELAKELNLDISLVNGLFSARITYPIEMNDEKLFEIKSALMSDIKKLELGSKQKIAKELREFRPKLGELMNQIYGLDFAIAVGTFGIKYNLNAPVLSAKNCIAFKKAKNLRLFSFLEAEKIEAVDYVIGASSIFPEHKENATLITGANSGGKTTLLEMIAQAAILSLCGLGAPAEEAEAGAIEELYFFRKKHRSDAGAFETLLRNFEKITLSQKLKLILADEIEAVTEPGAAAKILAALVEFFKDKNSLIAIVTHLGEDIKKHFPGVRVDGIEAKGLDEEFRLIVSRNPVLNKLAKSTPELIVERLSKTRDGKEFYDYILKKFKK